MNKKKLFYSLFIVFLFLSACASNNTFKLAHSFYKKKNWIIAINFYDKYIKDHRNRAEATIAELERSSCYYYLGLKAYKNKNYELAKKFFFLSNSEQADKLLDNCYYQFAISAYKNLDVENTLKNYEIILKYYPDSELIPQILYNQIKIYLLLNDKTKAYEKYDFLCKNYPKNKYIVKAQPLIDKIVPEYLNKAKELVNQNKFNQALKIYFKLEKNPSKYNKKIKNDIADTYIKMGEKSISEEKYIEAKLFFEKAKKWNPDFSNLVNKKLLNIVDLFIKKGNKLINEEKLDEAIKNFKSIFDIIPNYKPAIEKINFAKQLKINFAKADSLYSIAKQLEEQKNYKKALKYYTESYKLHKKSTVYKDIIHMKNIIRANKEPKIFAKEILINYKNGIIVKNINKLVSSLKKVYKSDVKVVEWKTYYSFGKYKYEVRYDITTPDKNYYFIWRVNLEFQTISPLNKISKEYMGVLK